MGLGFKKNMARIFTFIMLSVFSGVLSQSAGAATTTCSPGDGSWPCFAAERAAKKAAKRARAKRTLRRRAAKKYRANKRTTKKRSSSRKKFRSARKYRRILRKSGLQNRSSRKNRSRRTGLRNDKITYLGRNGRKISKRRAMALKRKANRSKSRRKNKLRHNIRKKKSAFNRGFSLRGRYMRVTSRSIKTSCFPRRLKSLIRRVENHYGKRLVVTSGHRSRGHNRRIGGARRSEHVHCKAVDFRIPGVNKYALARFVKRLPGVGGVGTYCGKSTIHMDIGKRRSWNYGCGKKRSRKRRYAKRRKARRSYRTTSSRRAQRKKWNFSF